MKIIKQENSKLLPRIDIIAEVSHVGKRTPSSVEAREELSKTLKVDKDLILVDHVYSEFGAGVSKIIAYVYDSKESMERIIKKSKKQKEAEAKAIEEAKKKSQEEAKAKEEAARAAAEASKEEEKLEENGEE